MNATDDNSSVELNIFQCPLEWCRSKRKGYFDFVGFQEHYAKAHLGGLHLYTCNGCISNRKVTPFKMREHMISSERAECNPVNGKIVCKSLISEVDPSKLEQLQKAVDDSLRFTLKNLTKVLPPKLHSLLPEEFQLKPKVFGGGKVKLEPGLVPLTNDDCSVDGEEVVGGSADAGVHMADHGVADRGVSAIESSRVEVPTNTMLNNKVLDSHMGTNSASKMINGGGVSVKATNQQMEGASIIVDDGFTMIVGPAPMSTVVSQPENVMPVFCSRPDVLDTTVEAGPKSAADGNTTHTSNANIDKQADSEPGSDDCFNQPLLIVKEAVRKPIHINIGAFRNGFPNATSMTESIRRNDITSEYVPIQGEALKDIKVLVDDMKKSIDAALAMGSEYFEENITFTYQNLLRAKFKTSHVGIKQNISSKREKAESKLVGLDDSVFHDHTTIQTIRDQSAVNLRNLHAQLEKGVPVRNTASVSQSDADMDSDFSYEAELLKSVQMQKSAALNKRIAKAIALTKNDTSLPGVGGALLATNGISGTDARSHLAAHIAAPDSRNHTKNGGKFVRDASSSKLTIPTTESSPGSIKTLAAPPRFPMPASQHRDDGRHADGGRAWSGAYVNMPQPVGSCNMPPFFTPMPTVVADSNRTRNGPDVHRSRGKTPSCSKLSPRRHFFSGTNGNMYQPAETYNVPLNYTPMTPFVDEANIIRHVSEVNRVRGKTPSRFMRSPDRRQGRSPSRKMSPLRNDKYLRLKNDRRSTSRERHDRRNGRGRSRKRSRSRTWSRSPSRRNDHYTRSQRHEKRRRSPSYGS